MTDCKRLMEERRSVNFFDAAQPLTPELLRQVFRVQGEVVADSDGRAALLMQGLDRKSEQENRRT